MRAESQLSACPAVPSEVVAQAGLLSDVSGLRVLKVAALLLSIPLLWVPGFPVLTWEAWSRVAVLWCCVLALPQVVCRRQDTVDSPGRWTATVLVLAALVIAVGHLNTTRGRQTRGQRACGRCSVGGACRRAVPAAQHDRPNPQGRLLLLAHLTHTRRGVGRVWLAAAGLMVAVLVAGLTLTYSRAGWLGLLPGLLALSVLAWRRMGYIWLVPWYGLAAGWALMSVLLMTHGVAGGRPVLSAPATPRLQIWGATAALIREFPWNGIGYGQLAHRFPDGPALLHQVQIDHTIITYPHNELLLWWVEGGVVAPAGLRVLLGGGVLLLCPPPRVAASRGGYGAPGASGPGRLLCLAPVLVHWLLEFPLYQSPPHLSQLDLLPAFALRDTQGEGGVSALRAR